MPLTRLLGHRQGQLLHQRAHSARRPGQRWQQRLLLWPPAHVMGLGFVYLPSALGSLPPQVGKLELGPALCDKARPC